MVIKRPMVAFLSQLLLAIRSRFTRRARLEAENLTLRQQLIVLRRKSPTRVRLWNIDRLLLVWLYRLYPSLMDAIIIVHPETQVIDEARPGQSCLLMMYVTESESAVPAELGPSAAQLRLAGPVRHRIGVHDFRVSRKLAQSWSRHGRGLTRR